MLRKLRMENFKSLMDVELDLKKINLLIGLNNSGKTSILQSLALVKQLFKEPGRYATSVDFLKDFGFGEFEEVVSCRKLVPITISASINFDQGEIQHIKDIVKDTVYETFDLSSVGYAISFSEDLLMASLETPKRKLVSAKYERKNGGWTPSEEKVPELESASFRLDFPKVSFSSGPGKIGDTHRALLRSIENNFKRIFYCPSLRGLKELGYSIPGRMPMDVGSMGENAPGIYVYMRDKVGLREVYDKVRNWFDELGLEDLTPRIVEGPKITIEGIDKELKVPVRLANVGFGLNQLFSAMLQCFYTEKSLIMIEQPEIHFHPRHQSRLPEIFNDIKKHGNQLIVETHSEHVIMGIQRLIAKGELKPEEVALYYVEKKPEKGTIVNKLTIEERGRIKEGLPGFFEVDFEEAMEILESLRR